MALVEPDEKRWGLTGRREKLVVLLTILISISLARQGQTGSQNPRGPWLNLSMFLFSQTVCLSPDPPQVLAIPGMTLVFYEALLWRAQR